MPFRDRIISAANTAFICAALLCLASPLAAGEKSFAERYGGPVDKKSNPVLIEMLSYPEYALAARRELVRRGDKAVLDVAAAAELSDHRVRYYAVAILDQISGMDAEEAILKRLSDDEPTVRARAAFAIGKLKKDKHVGPLAKALENETDEIARGAFITALSAIDDTAATRPLIKAFTEKGDFAALAALTARPGVSREPLEQTLKSSPKALVRKRAAFALGAIADKASTAVLSAAATGDKNSEVKFAAVLALAAIGGEENLARLLRENPPSVPKGRRALGVVTELRKKIDKSFGSGSAEQIDSLRRNLLGNPPSRALVPVLAKYLNSEHAVSCDAAAEILGRWGYPECAAALAKALNGPGPIDRKAIIEALGRTRRSEVLPLLAREAASRDAERRCTAAYALSFLRTPAARIILTPMASDPNAKVRGVAVIVLAAFPDKLLTPVFIRALCEDDPYVRAAAVRWFGSNRILSESTAVIARIDKEISSNVKLEIIRAIGKWTVQANAMLISRFLSGRHGLLVRTTAAEALGKHKSQTAAFALIRAFNDAYDASARPSGALIFIEPMGRTGQMIVLAPLTKLLDDRGWQAPDLKALVVRALGHLGKKTSAAKIAELVKKTDTPPNLLKAAVEALGRIGGPAACVTLISFVRNENSPLEARRAALDGLVKTGTHVSMKIVRAMLSREEFTCAAAKALGGKEPQTVTPHLVSLLGKSKKWKTRAECAKVLADIPGAAATAALARALNDDDDSVRLAAAAALIKRGSLAPLKYRLTPLQGAQLSATVRVFEKVARHAVIQRLVSALDSPDSTVRSMARLLLANLGDGVEPASMALPEDLTAEEEKERIKAWMEWWKQIKERK